MTNDLTVFMRVAVDEEPLLRAVERISGMACESSSSPNEAARAYFMLLEYSQGFQLGVSLTWHPSIKSVLVTGELAQGLANEFKTDVLFEAEDSIADTDRERWLLASPNRSELRAVKLRELPDGVDLANEP